MRFLVLGCSYRTAPVELREALAFAADELGPCLRELVTLDDVDEALILSTCNRVELWCVARRAGHAARELERWLGRSRDVSRDQLHGALYSLVGEEALQHVYRVTSSLDAMVVGEAQVTGQVKDAYAAASAAGTTHAFLNRCLHRALATSKRVRTETGIARHPVSISSVAADLAARVFGDLSHSTVLVLGAGEMAELAVRHLRSHGASDIRVVNRTHEKAVALAFSLGARAHKLDDLDNQLLLADIVVASTGSREPVLTKKMIGATMRQRKQRPMFLVDIAVPRDVERKVGKLANVYLFDIDGLDQVVSDNLKARRKEAGRGEAIVRQEVARFSDWLARQVAVPVIKDLRRHFAEVVRAEADHAAQELDLSDPRQAEVLDTMANAIVNKLLHRPTVELKQHAVRPDGIFLAKAARHLFHLADGSTEVPNPDIPEEES